MAAGQRRGPKPQFWFAVGGVSILAQMTWNVLTDRFRDRLPAGLVTLNDYATRRNG